MYCIENWLTYQPTYRHTLFIQFLMQQDVISWSFFSQQKYKVFRQFHCLSKMVTFPFSMSLNPSRELRPMMESLSWLSSTSRSVLASPPSRLARAPSWLRLRRGDMQLASWSHGVMHMTCHDVVSCYLRLRSVSCSSVTASTHRHKLANSVLLKLMSVRWSFLAQSWIMSTLHHV